MIQKLDLWKYKGKILSAEQDGVVVVLSYVKDKKLVRYESIPIDIFWEMVEDGEIKPVENDYE